MEKCIFINIILTFHSLVSHSLSNVERTFAMSNQTERPACTFFAAGCDKILCDYLQLLAGSAGCSVLAKLGPFRFLPSESKYVQNIFT